MASMLPGRSIRPGPGAQARRQPQQQIAATRRCLPARGPRPVRAKDPDTQVEAAVSGGLINPQFAAVLAEALQRSGGERATLENAAGSIEEEKALPVKHVEEMLVAAIHTSRGTLRRLVERQALLEAEIASEQKQAARLAWLLNRVRSDYAYFSAVDKMNQESE